MDFRMIGYQNDGERRDGFKALCERLKEVKWMGSKAGAQPTWVMSEKN